MRRVIEASNSRQLFCSSKWVVLSSVPLILDVVCKAKIQVGVIVHRHRNLRSNIRSSKTAASPYSKLVAINVKNRTTPTAQIVALA